MKTLLCLLLASAALLPGQVTGQLVTTGANTYTPALQTMTNLQLVGVPVASLPACSATTKGSQATVTDSNGAPFTAGIGPVVAGGGSTVLPVFCDGTNWMASAAPVSSFPSLNVICRNYQLGSAYLDGSGTGISKMGRKTCTTIGPVSQLVLAFRGVYNSTNGNEVPNPSPMIYNVTLEYSSATVLPQFTVGGQTTFVVQPGNAITLTDPMGVAIPAATTFNIRVYQRVATPPTSPSAATSTAPGVLANGASGTQYFYKVTAVDNGIESGPTAEFSATTTANTGTALALSWTAAANATPSFYNIYRSLTTNTEVLVAKIPAPGTGYIDNGLGQITGSTTVPPAASQMTDGATTFTGDYVTANNTTTANTTQTTGTGGFTAGPSAVNSASAFVVLGNDLTAHPKCGLGDSIQAGTGIPQFTFQLASGSQPENNWFSWGLTKAGSYNFLNMSVPSAQLGKMLNFSQGVSARWALLKYCANGDVLSNLGINDVSTGGLTWQQDASNDIALGKIVKAMGSRLWLTTLSPSTTSGGKSWTTLADQTVTATESSRTNKNIWIRTGRCLDGSAAPTLTCGTAVVDSSIIAGYFDMANASGEVNSSGVPTANGGFWPVQAAGSPDYTFTLSGAQTVTALAVSGTPFPATTSLGGCVVVMTSGGANTQTATVSTNPSTSTLTLYGNNTTTLSGNAIPGLTVQPSAADTGSLYCKENTSDGVHHTLFNNNNVAVTFATWIAANWIP